jgi:hypothetical protein
LEVAAGTPLAAVRIPSAVAEATHSPAAAGIRSAVVTPAAAGGITAESTLEQAL